jgi:hypothetical protein
MLASFASMQLESDSRTLENPHDSIRSKTALINHLVGGGEQRRRHIKPERPGGFQVDHQLELDRRLDRKLARFCALDERDQ